MLQIPQHKPRKCGRMVSKRDKVDRWFLGETLGKGEYSWVKKGYHMKNGSVVALKFISTVKGDGSATQLNIKQIQNEINALKKIKHKHILQLLACNVNATYQQKDGLIIPSVLLVWDYVSGGELFDILYFASGLSEKITRTYFKQLIDGMTILHDAGICHRNIKPQNLLLDANFQLKITDFGLTKLFEKNRDTVTSTFYVGTKAYQSPETLQKKEYTTACDIFGCGVVLFILLAHYPPFEAATTKCRYYAPLTHGKAREFWKQHRGCGISGSAKDLITRMIWYDPNKRISIRGIKKHKWYNCESLSAKDLASELRKLHRLMEINRTWNAEKQKQSYNHGCYECAMFKRVWNQYRIPSATEREIQEYMEPKSFGDEVDRREEYWNGDVIPYFGEIYEAYLRIQDESDRLDVFSIFNEGKICDLYVQRRHDPNILYNNKLVERIVNELKGWNYIYHEYTLIIMGFCRKYYLNKHYNNNVYGFPNGIILLIINIVKSIDIDSSPKIAEFAKKGSFENMYLEIWVSEYKLKCIAPSLPPNEGVTLKDVYTTCQPWKVLKHIEKNVIALDGTSNVNLKQASLEAHLATHNFPAPVAMEVRIFEDSEKECYLVKFERIGGDVLHFGRVLKQLIGKCGSHLTGVPRNRFKCSDKDRQEAERLFGDNPFIQQ